MKNNRITSGLVTRSVLTAVWLAVGATAAMQPAVTPPARIDGTSLAGLVEIPRLVDLTADRLHLRLEYDANALKAAGAVTLRSDKGLTDDELWSLTNRVLAERGFTTIRLPEGIGYSVVKMADAAGRTDLFGPPRAGPAPGFKVAVARAKNRPAKELLDALTKVLSKPGGSAQAIGEGGLILIADLSTTVDQALKLLDLIDVPGPEAAIEEVQAHNLSAQALATAVAQVCAKREIVTGEKIAGEVLASASGNALLIVAPVARVGYWRELAQRLDSREKVETLTYAPRSFGLKEVAKLVEATIKDQPGTPPDDRWRLVADDLTGTLIVTATPSQQEQIRALVERLNQSPISAQRPVRSFTIKHRPVKEVQAVLEQLLAAGVLNPEAPPGAEPKADGQESGLAPWPPPVAPQTGTIQPPGPRGMGGQTAVRLPGAASPGRTSEQAVSFTADDGTNSLMVMGEPRVLAQIESLLAGLDIRQPQVMLEVLIVSLSDSQTLDLGVELEAQISSGSVTGRLASLFGLGSRGPNGDRTAGDGNGFTGLVLSPGDFAVVLRALQTINKGRSLSMPRLLAANNQQATLDSVLTQPYASTNASNTVTTTSFGGAQEAGTQVTLKPQIGAGDQLNLEYSISLSAFVGAPASANLPPPKQQNKVQSAASFPDGYTVAVGGIELNAEGQGTSQVPGLGDIPILGEAFKNKSKNASRSRFYVFIRANVLRNQNYEDLKYLSGVASKNAGVDDGFPEVEPQVIR